MVVVSRRWSTHGVLVSHRLSVDMERPPAYPMTCCRILWTLRQQVYCVRTIHSKTQCQHNDRQLHKNERLHAKTVNRDLQRFAFE